MYIHGMPAASNISARFGSSSTQNDFVDFVDPLAREEDVPCTLIT